MNNFIDNHPILSILLFVLAFIILFPIVPIIFLGLGIWSILGEVNCDQYGRPKYPR